MDNIFSWQQHDFERLCLAAESEKSMFLLHGKDFASPYHVVSSFFSYLVANGKVLFFIYTKSPNLHHPLFPYTQAANLAFSKSLNSHQEKSILPSIVKDLTQLDTLESLVQSITDEQHSSIILNERENELLLRFEYAAQGYTPIFIFYGYSKFDSESKELTAILLSGSLNESFPFLKNVKFVFLEENEEEEDVLNPIREYEHIDIQLSEPDLTNMEEILSELANDLNFSSAEKEKLFYLSGGQLSIIQIVLEYLRNTHKEMPNSTQENLIQIILKDRIAKMGKGGLQLKSVLESAASIGNPFSISLLKHIEDPRTCDDVLKKGNREFFIENTESTGRFIYDEIWRFFYSNLEKKRKTEIAYSLERAVYYFNPYDYYTRACFLERAGDNIGAFELYLYAYNSLFQEGFNPNKTLEEKLATLSKECGYDAFWASLLQVYQKMNDLEYEVCVELLENISYLVTTRLLLLKEYLIGLCVHRLGDSIIQQEKAMFTMQSAATHAKDVEDGMWCDCETTLISFIVNKYGDYEEARRICKELIYYYTQKKFSEFAQKGFHVLERKWSALYSVEKAIIKTESSVKYFCNSVYPAQYVMALNNHAANLIELGKYDLAEKHLKQAISVIHEHPSLHINRMYLLNNYCLCAVLGKKISPIEVYEKLDIILKNLSFGDWIIIFKINFCIYAAICGKIERAEELLLELEKICLQIEDDYYLFYIYANLAAILYLEGRRDEAVYILKNKCSTAPLLCKTTEKIYLEERTQLWINVMKETTILNSDTFDTFILNKHPEGTQWSFIGRGFLYSDIQFWSES